MSGPRRCADITAVNDAADALVAAGCTADQADDLRLYARALAARGVLGPTIEAHRGRAYAVWSTADVGLTYCAGPEGHRSVRAVTLWDNGHLGAFELPVRAVGLAAALLLVRS